MIKASGLFWLLLMVPGIYSTAQITPLNDDTTAAYIVNAIGNVFSATCALLVQSNHVTMYEKFRIHRMIRMIMHHRSGSLKTVVIKNFRGYIDHVAYRYNTYRCPRMLHIFYGTDEKIRPYLETLSRSVNMSGPLWIIFPSVDTSPSDFLENVDIPFNSKFISAKIQNGTADLEEVYRVSMSHPLRIIPFGRWTPEDGLILFQQRSFYWKRTNLEGKVFRISTLGLESSGDIHQHEMAGYFREVWQNLGEVLNFSSVRIKPKLAVTGAWNGHEWTGLIGMVHRKEIDAAVSEITLTPERLDAVDFLKPLFTTRYQLFFKQPGLMIQWDVILTPFRKEVWLAVLCWLISVTIFLDVGYRIGLKYGFESSNKKDHAGYNCAFIMVSAFVQQGNAFLPKSTSCRIIVFTGYMFSTITMIIYAGTLTSMITVQKPSRPFDSLESFLMDGTYELEQIPSSAGYSYFANSSDPSLQEIYKRLFSKLPEDQLPDTESEALRRVCEKDRIVHLGEFDTAKITASKLFDRTGCSLLYLERPLRLLHLGIAIPKDSPYKEALDHALGNMTALGIVRRIRNKNFPLIPWPPPASFQPVQGEQIAQVYIVFVFGIFISMLLLSGESLMKLLFRFIKRFR